MGTEEPAVDFEPVLGGLIDPATAGLAAQLSSVTGLGTQERRALVDGTADVLRGVVWRKLSRVLVLELNAARITGRLTGDDPTERFGNWVAEAARPAAWTAIGEHYPTLLPRLRTVIANRCAATRTMAERFAQDRAALTGLTGFRPDELSAVFLGAGDSHHGGQTVAVLRCAGGRVVYKPRPVQVDAELDRLLGSLLTEDPAHRIRVPRVLVRPGYGWAQHVAHAYCADSDELCSFYRGIGHWLAVMRLVGGSDLHAENLIAVGPTPVVVDCETLFSPHAPRRDSGFGQALDQAGELVGGSVLRTGLLPGRGLALGWRGVDPSAVGALPGQQPAALVPVLTGAGTDAVRVELMRQPVPVVGTNHPSPDPVLDRYWPQVLDGFGELTERLRRLDRDGELVGLLTGFRDCRVRVVTRDTQSYVELARMLWHPASLHDEPAALRRATEVLTRHAVNSPIAAGDPGVIAAELAELRTGDIPVFTTTAGCGRLTGPGGSSYRDRTDLVEAALVRWRETDFALDRQVIKAALVSAYLNEAGVVSDPPRLVVDEVRCADLDRRRRSIAARILRDLRDTAITGTDGTVTWIAPVLRPTGWAVQPFYSDVYNGLAGVAILLAGYLAEVEAGRADPVAGAADLLPAVLRGIRTVEDQWARERRGAVVVRPDAPGGYTGLGSRIWGWLLLRRLGAVGDDALDRAVDLAAQLPEAVRADDTFDILSGMSGAVVPLLRLAEHTGQPEWTELAVRIGERLATTACRRDGLAYWPNAMFGSGVGGFAHGSTGIGWALWRLADATGLAEPAVTAESAFAHEESLFDPDLDGWLDLRQEHRTMSAWCHGGAGIGIAAADLSDRIGEQRCSEVLRRAARGCLRDGLGWSHTLCHGDLGNWELLNVALARGLAPTALDGTALDHTALDGTALDRTALDHTALDRTALDGYVLSSIEQHGPTIGLAREVSSVALVPGAGGIAYQLLRMHPDCPLPSMLLPDPGPPVTR